MAARLSFSLMTEAPAPPASELDASALRLRQGDPAALPALVAALGPRVLRLARDILGDDHLAEDAAQEAYLAWQEGIGTYDPGRPFLTWALRVAVNKALDLDRSRRRGRRHLLAFGRGRRPRTSPGPGRSAGRAELRQVLDGLLEELPPQQRRAFVLRDLQELSMADTAEILGCSLGAAKASVSFARRRIRNLVATRHPEYLEDPSP